MSNVMSGNPSRHRGGPWQPLRLIPSGRVAGEYTGGSLDHMAGETHSAAEEPRRPAPRHSVRTFSQRAWARVAEVAARRMAPLAASPVPEPEPVLPPPPEEVLDLLRHLGITMSRAGEPADRVALILGRRHRVRRHRPHVLRGADRSVRAHRPRPSSSVDFETGASTPLRLDQVDALYRLIDDIRPTQVDAEGARARLQDLLTVEPRFGAIAAILGSGVLTVGLGLMLNPTASALPAFLFPGLLVGMLRVGGPRADPQPRPAGCRRHCRDLAGVQVAGACTRHISTGHRHPLAGHLPAGRSADHGDSLFVNGRHARGIGAPGRRLGTPTPPDLRHHHGRALRRAGAVYQPCTSPGARPGWACSSSGRASTWPPQRRGAHSAGCWSCCTPPMACRRSRDACWALKRQFRRSRDGPAGVLRDPEPPKWAARAGHLPPHVLLVPGRSTSPASRRSWVRTSGRPRRLPQRTLSIVAIAVGVLVGSGISERIGQSTSTWRGI